MEIQIAKLLINELFPRLKRAGIGVEDSPVTPLTVSILAMGKARGLISTDQIRKALNEDIR